MRDTLPLPQEARRVAWLNYLLLGSFYVGLMIVLSDPVAIVYGVPTALKVLLILPLISIVLAVWMLVNAVRLIADNRYRLSGRAFYAFISLVAVAALWQLYYWNFLGFNY